VRVLPAGRCGAGSPSLLLCRCVIFQGSDNFAGPQIYTSKFRGERKLVESLEKVQVDDFLYFGAYARRLVESFFI
jgi:hypothetical protein